MTEANGKSCIAAFADDAAGRHVSLNSTHTRYSNSYPSTFVTTNTQTYDGDSQVVRSTEQQTQSGFLVKNITRYYLRSSVLGGRTITEYDAAGARRISYTYAGSGVLTETTKTYNDAPWQQWRHTNPVTGDAVNTDTQGKQTGVTRLDPAGTNVGESDPFIDTGGGGGGGGGESPAEADRVGLVPIGAGWGGGGGGSSGMRCNLDGVEIGCGWVMQMMDIGAAAQCPNNDCSSRRVYNHESQRDEWVPVTVDPATGQAGYWRSRLAHSQTGVNGNMTRESVVPFWIREFVTDPATFFNSMGLRGYGFRGMFLLAVAGQPQGPAPIPTPTPCSSTANLAGAGTDEGALSRLIFQEATSSSRFGSDAAYRVELQAVASVVLNRVAFLNQPGLAQSGTLGFGNVGASIADVVYSRGNNPNGRSSIGTQFAGFTPNGISQGIQDNINRALNSPVGSADCNKLLDAIGTARNFRPGGSDDFGLGRIYAMRTARSGSPGGAFSRIGAPPGSGNVFYGLR